MSHRHARIFAPLFIFALSIGEVHAAPWTFTEVAGSVTPIPGGTGNFTGFGTPALDGADIAFRGLGSGGQIGIYSFVGGGISVVADMSSAIPEGTGSFTNFGHPSLQGGHIAFTGNGTGNQQGIYTTVGGLSRVADRTTPLPGGSGTFVTLAGSGNKPSLDNQRVAFHGLGLGGQQGIYTDVAGLALIANTVTPNPGAGSNFSGFLGPVSLDGNDIAFVGLSGTSQDGVFAHLAGLLVRIAGRNTAIPGGTGNFSGFFQPIIDDGKVAFRGSGSSGQTGIYVSDGTTLHPVVDQDTAIPGGPGHFNSFSAFSYDAGSLTFLGSGDAGQSGIYADFGGGLEAVITTSMSLNGKSIQSLAYGSEGMSGTALSFIANFSDGSFGIFRAEQLEMPVAVPAPAAWPSICISIATAMLWTRQRRSRTARP